ncbi:MAG: XdhC family protein [Anaerolineae bacterium]|nr:XdhC family protein [Anaerolineae bacterium]
MSSFYSSVYELEKSGQNGAICTIIDTRGSTPRHVGSKMLVFADGHITGTVGGGEVENRTIQEALGAIKDGKNRLLSYDMVDPERGDPGICGGTLQIFIEPILSKPLCLIVGVGHVGRCVTRVAKFLEYRVIVSDDRPEFCGVEASPEADEIIECKMSELPDKLDLSGSYVILTTRGTDVDIEGLPNLIDANPAYIGIIGSKRRWLNTRNKLIELGFPQEKIDRVHSPIGLELNAETPEEIAISIMAELILIRNGGSGLLMKYTPKK